MPAFSDSYGGATGINEMHQAVVVSAEAEEIILYASVAARKAGRQQAVFRFRDECEWTNEGTVLDCGKGVKSPLAGAMFERRLSKNPKHKNNCGNQAEILVCRTGCTSRVPKYLKEHQWEC
jgi:hypothetical protein